jgi:(1->4)-alpha-D-glucan 1-alpha-D-glucosylmutase
VADIYRGSELWDHTLVDPDNRRPVDWDLCRALLAQAISPPLEEDEQGAGKIVLLRSLLQLRKQWPALFAEGEYRPIPAAAGIVAFARRTTQADLLVAASVRIRAYGDVADLDMSLFPSGNWQPILGGSATPHSLRRHHLPAIFLRRKR